MNYVFQPDSVPVVPVSDPDLLFPVHRIYCVGKNYTGHVREMGFEPKDNPPCFFMKPADAVTITGQVPYPPGTNNYHYEIELVIGIGKQGKNISSTQALEYIYGYAIGFDMTRRDLQMTSGSLGHPWETGKSFDNSAPLSPLFPVATVGHIAEGRITMEVNGELRQDADIGDMIWKSHEIIALLSALYELKPGDLVFTGTPAGVGAVLAGDTLCGRIEQLGELSIEITESD